MQYLRAVRNRQLLGQPLLYLRLPGHPFPIGYLVNPQNQ